MEALVATEAEPARRSRSARPARRDNAARIAGVPYIARNIPTYDILGEENLQKIERVADRILSEVGIEFRDDPASLDHWKRAGAKVEGMLVRFEPGMLNEIVSTAPAQFTQHARNPTHNVEIGGKNVVFSPAYGSPFVMDLDKGRRYGTLEDFRNFIKLAQSSPWLHHSGGTICEPVDVPVNKRHLDMVYSHIKYSDRAFMGSITAEERAEDSIDMARIVFGRHFVDQHCVILGNVNVNSRSSGTAR
jgi:trimethylamine--corrinoid protein Co-methyltransferase